MRRRRIRVRLARKGREARRAPAARTARTVRVAPEVREVQDEWARRLVGSLVAEVLAAPARTDLTAPVPADNLVLGLEGSMAPAPAGSMAPAVQALDLALVTSEAPRTVRTKTVRISLGPDRKARSTKQVLADRRILVRTAPVLAADLNTKDLNTKDLTALTTTARRISVLPSV